jgi:hypothetical protein
MARRPWLRPFRQAPASAAYLLVLVLTSVIVLELRPIASPIVLASASTNLHNMSVHPIAVLVVSAFLMSSAAAIVPMALLVTGVMAPVERAIGTARTLVAFAAGHVGATLITVLGIAFGVARGWLPAALEAAIDVGPSYGLASISGVLAAQLPTRRRRWSVIAVLFGVGGLAFALDPGFTAAGHVIALVLGLLVGPRLGRTIRTGGPNQAPPAGEPGTAQLPSACPVAGAGSEFRSAEPTLPPDQPRLAQERAAATRR